MSDARKTNWLLVGPILALIVALPLLFGKGGIVAAVVLTCVLFSAPIFVLIGVITVTCFVLWLPEEPLHSVLIERIRALSDPEALLAVPLFILSGAIMSRGEISARLINFSKAIVGFIPGGLAMSAVVACMLFAAISGSSPATVVAIGAMMAPSLIKNGYDERFSHGLLTSAGSLGILIPPSIPMIIFPIVYQGEVIKVEQLFASGIGPGLIMGAILMGFSFYRGLVDKAPREPFSISNIARAATEGFWALMFPVLILGGIYGGIFTAVEAAAISVVYAVIVEVFLHRALSPRKVLDAIQETGIFLGALLVIMVAALAFNEFLEQEAVPRSAVEWIEAMELSKLQFLLIVNILLLIVGMAMDILSAMFVFVPLLAPIAVALGVDPMHFAIIFIVNLEIGYLTPPIGLNLFVASTLFDKPVGHIIRSVVPFVVLMLGGLILITYVPAVSVGLGAAIVGVEEPRGGNRGGGVRSMEDMMNDPDEDGGTGERVLSMEEMMNALEDDEGDDDDPSDERVLSIEEMMEQADDEDFEDEELDYDDEEAAGDDTEPDNGEPVDDEPAEEAADEPEPDDGEPADDAEEPEAAEGDDTTMTE